MAKNAEPSARPLELTGQRHCKGKEPETADGRFSELFRVRRTVRVRPRTNDILSPVDCDETNRRSASASRTLPGQRAVFGFLNLAFADVREM